MTDPNAHNQQIISEFRAHRGSVGGGFEGAPLLLLHTTGAKSGLERINPVMYQQVGASIAVFASKGGAPTSPDWFHNVVANPRVEIEIGSETRRVVARIAEGVARDEIWERQKAEFPQFAGYEEKTDRQIPVVLLDPE